MIKNNNAKSDLSKSEFETELSYSTLKMNIKPRTGSMLSDRKRPKMLEQ